MRTFWQEKNSANYEAWSTYILNEKERKNWRMDRRLTYLKNRYKGISLVVLHISWSKLWQLATYDIWAGAGPIIVGCLMIVSVVMINDCPMSECDRVASLSQERDDLRMISGLSLVRLRHCWPLIGWLEWVCVARSRCSDNVTPSSLHLRPSIITMVTRLWLQQTQSAPIGHNCNSTLN